MTRPFRVRNRILCSPVAVPSNGSYLQITANMPLMCLVVHAAEKFLRVFMFPSCGRHRQQGLKTVSIRCATTLHLGYAWKSLWTVVILPECARCSLLQLDARLTNTDFTLCYEELLKILLAREKCCHLHGIIQNIQLWSLEDKSSVLFFDSWRSLTRSESSFCAMLCGSAEVTFRKNSVLSAEL